MILLAEVVATECLPERIGAIDIIIEGAVDEFDDLNIFKFLKAMKVRKCFIHAFCTDLFKFFCTRQTVSATVGTAARGLIIENIPLTKLVFAVRYG